MITTEAQARAFVEKRAADGTTGDSAFVAMERLEQLLTALIAENEQQNLISRGSVEFIWSRHLADSAQLLDHVPRETLVGGAFTAKPWLDLGVGAGFPGLVIAALRPQMPVILVESRARRVEWLERIVSELELEHCRVVGSRLELIDSFEASVISARAFAPLGKLLKLSARFSTSGTYWVLPKGRKAAQEVGELPKPLRKMFHVEQSQTDAEAGIIVGKGRVSKV